MIGLLVPATRHVDNMALSINSPQEDEYAVANLTPHSMYHHWSFPQRADYYFKRYALMRDVPPDEMAAWKRVYYRVLQKAALYMGSHRQLVIKNPCNTGRIPQLLEMFPDARFIHIYRNPYTLFPSTLHLYEKTLEIAALQEITREQVEADILHFYQEIMQQFFKDKDLIPAKNLIEVKFENLESDPMRELRRIYDSLGLREFSEAEAPISAYLDSLSDYKKNKYEYSDDVLEKVRREWQFAIDRWGYEPPQRN